MKVILHLLAMPTYAGAESVVISLIRGFREQGLSHRFIYASPDGPIRHFLEADSIEFAPISKLCISEIRRLIRTYQPDIIHAHDFTAGTLCALAAGHTPVFSHIHNNPIWLHTINPRTIIYGLSCLRHRKLLSVSPAVFNEFIFGKLFRHKIHMVGNPFDAERVRRLALQTADIPCYDVAFIGRLHTQKNPLRFLKVIEQLHNLRPETTAIMIGDGEMQEEVAAYIHKHGLQHRVTLAGFQSNPYPLLANSRLLCSTSSWEGFGLVILEALCLGKPVVATSVGGIPTIINGSEGILCSEDDALVHSMLHLLTDDAEYSRRSAAALRRAAELDNLAAYVHNLAALYG